MRLLIEIVLAAALIALAWEKSLKDRASEIPWIGDKIVPVVETQRPRSQIRPAVTPAPTVSGAWMWDPNRKSPLDLPKKPPASTPH